MQLLQSRNVLQPNRLVVVAVNHENWHFHLVVIVANVEVLIVLHSEVVLACAKHLLVKD